MSTVNGRKFQKSSILMLKVGLGDKISKNVREEGLILGLGYLRVLSFITIQNTKKIIKVVLYFVGLTITV